jgi:hypothetical protein
MTDQELIKAYSVGFFMMMLADEFNDVMRPKQIAVIRNKINKKHEHFLNRIRKVNAGKMDHTHKSMLFSLAGMTVQKCWDEALKTGLQKPFTANAAIKMLYFKNSSHIQQIYGISAMDIENIAQGGPEGSMMASVKAVNTILEKLDEVIQNTETKI